MKRKSPLGPSGGSLPPFPPTWYGPAYVIGTARMLCGARSFFVTVGLWCPSFCPSMGPAANALLDVCCCGPSGLDISIDRCSSGVQRVNAGSATLSAHVR